MTIDKSKLENFIKLYCLSDIKILNIQVIEKELIKISKQDKVYVECFDFLTGNNKCEVNFGWLYDNGLDECLLYDFRLLFDYKVSVDLDENEDDEEKEYQEEGY